MRRLHLQYLEVPADNHAPVRPVRTLELALQVLLDALNLPLTRVLCREHTAQVDRVIEVSLVEPLRLNAGVDLGTHRPDRAQATHRIAGVDHVAEPHNVLRRHLLNLPYRQTPLEVRRHPRLVLIRHGAYLAWGPYLELHRHPQPVTALHPVGRPVRQLMLLNETEALATGQGLVNTIDGQQCRMVLYFDLFAPLLPHQ